MKSHIDLYALVSYIAGGGLAGVSALLAVLYPGHSAVITAAATAIVAIAAAVRVTVVKSPPPGTQNALIPQGAIPVVADAPGLGAPSVATAGGSITPAAVWKKSTADAP